MHKKFSERGFADYMYWQTQDRKTLNRINNLLKIENETIEIYQCRTHYGDK